MPPQQKQTRAERIASRNAGHPRAVATPDIPIADARYSLQLAILSTPTGEARNALTLADIFLTYAKDVLDGRPTPVSLNDLTQQVATERYDAAMQRAAESRTT